MSMVQSRSIEPWGYWWPEPDIAVARGPQRQYEERHPGASDLALVGEVSDTSEQDWTRKLVGYGAAGVPVYWIVDLDSRRLEVHREPGPAGYSVVEVISEG